MSVAKHREDRVVRFGRAVAALALAACTSNGHAAAVDAGAPSAPDGAGAGAGDTGASSSGAPVSPAPDGGPGDDGASSVVAQDAGNPGAGGDGGGGPQPPGGDGGAGAPPDASSAGDGSSGAPGTSCPPGTIVCDDFESAAPGGAPAAPWTVAKNAGSVAIDTTRAFSGKQSVKMTSPAATGFRSVMLRLAGASLPPAGNVVYGRMMFWLDSAPTAQVHWTIIDGSGLVPGTNYHAVYRYGGQLPITGSDGGFAGSQMMASYDTPDSYNGTGPSSDCYHHSNRRAVPVGAWTCVQWKFDGPNATLTLSLGGVPAADLTVTQTGDGCVNQPATYVWTAPSFQQIDVGFESYQADDARAMWVDDVAIGTASIACP